jgi:hypothetical protein
MIIRLEACNGGNQQECDCDGSNEQLQAIQTRVHQLAPDYWKVLESSVCGIVRMTEQLYVLQDWDRTSGELMVYTLPTSS